MKKHLIFLVSLVMIFSFTMLSACGDSGSADLSDSEYVGTWVGDKMSLGDEETDFEHETTLVINGDGTGTMSDTEEEASEFTWEPVDGGFKTKGDVKATFKDEDGGIVAKIMGVNLHFVKVEE